MIVDEVRTNQFPKVTVRFSINPVQGRPPTYLELHDVFVVNDGILEVPLEAHTAGKVPTVWAGPVPGDVVLQHARGGRRDGP